MKHLTNLDGWGIALGSLLLACVIIRYAPESWGGGLLLGMVFITTALLFLRASSGSK